MSDRGVMVLRCEKCASAVLVPIGAAAGAIPCPVCGEKRDAKPDGVMNEAGLIHTCGGCGDEQFYIQKDFSRMMGCAIFSGTILLSVITAFVWGWIWWMLVLFTVSTLDSILYRMLPMVTVCYRCKTIYRGVPINPAHGPFDLATAEKYDADSPVMD